jgi:hypothetical protein
LQAIAQYISDELLEPAIAKKLVGIIKEAVISLEGFDSFSAWFLKQLLNFKGKPREARVGEGADVRSHHGHIMLIS